MIRTVDRPYPGTRPFQRADRDRFFGRALEADTLADLWRANSLTIVDGPTGSGKTSLLQAGVLPLVADRRTDVLPPGRISYGSTFPSAALPEHNPYSLALLRSWSPPGEEVTRLLGLTVSDFIRRRAGRRDGRILAVIDQAEELFAGSGPRRAYRRRLLAEITEALQVEPRLHLLLLVRENALELLSETLGHGARHHLMPLTPAGAFDAVNGPAARAGRPYDPEAVEEVVGALRTSLIISARGDQHYVADEYVQPSLLQVVCTHLWDSLPPDHNTITAREVRRHGNADVALAAYCGRVTAAIADDHDMPTGRLRSWLLGTFVTEHGTRGIAYEGTTETAGMPNTAARALEDRHLLAGERRSGSKWYELLSDRLIEPLRQAADEWPPPADAGAYLAAAQRALTLGEPGLAERYAEASLRTSRDTDLRLRAEANSLLGNLAYEREKAAEAESHYRTAAKLYEVVRDTKAVGRQLAAVGQMLLARGRPADAVGELRAAADRTPNDPVTQTELGLALWQLGQARAAVAVLSSVLSIDGGNADALRARGEILAELGEARNAMLDLDRVSLDNRPSTRAARGLALAKLGDYSAASQEIEDAVAEAPRNGPVLLYAARATALGGEEGEAMELAKRAMDASDPSLTPHHRDVTLQLLAEGADYHR